MKALTILNAVLLAVAAAFALTLGAVCIMYAVYLDAVPRIRSQWFLVLKVTLVFIVLTVAAAAAFWAQLWRLRWRWPAQSVLALTMASSTVVLLQILR